MGGLRKRLEASICAQTRLSSLRWIKPGRGLPSPTSAALTLHGVVFDIFDSRRPTPLRLPLRTPSREGSATVTPKPLGGPSIQAAGYRWLVAAAFWGDVKARYAGIGDQP